MKIKKKNTITKILIKFQRKIVAMTMQAIMNPKISRCLFRNRYPWPKRENLKLNKLKSISLTKSSI